MIAAGQDTRIHRLVVPAVAALLALGAAWYLYRVSLSVSRDAGYDFRYLWLAGRLWLDGVSPYLPGYQEAGAALIDRGHVPELWVYPPNWWAISSALGLTGLSDAGFRWNLTGIAFAALSSLLTVAAFRRLHPRAVFHIPGVGNLFAHGGALALLHFFGTAALEATALTLAVGQTSLLVLFGMALLLFGASRASLPLAVTGLALIFLKPQIGIVFLIVLPFLGVWARRLVLWAIAVSAALALPALIADPDVLTNFVRNVAAYDGFTDANLPQAMTGLRLAVWELIGRDIGNIAAAGVTVAAALLLFAGPFGPLAAAEPEVRVWQAVTLIVALMAAIAPLHYYDFVLVVALVPALLLARGLARVAGLIGGALILRADGLGKLTGLYDPEVAIFEGSILATIGGVLLLVAAADAVRRGGAGRAGA